MTTNTDNNAAADSAPATGKPKKKTKRRVLLLLGPLVVIAGVAYEYFTGGRFVETENA